MSPELSYLTQLVFKMWEETSKDPSDPERFTINIMYSVGANRDVNNPEVYEELAAQQEAQRTCRIEPRKVFCQGVTLKQLEAFMCSWVSQRVRQRFLYGHQEHSERGLEACPE